MLEHIVDKPSASTSHSVKSRLEMLQYTAQLGWRERRGASGPWGAAL